MHVITVEFVALPGHEGDLLARVRRQAADSLAREADCLQFDVCVDPKTPGRIFLYEVYRDEAAFQNHLDSAHFNDFNGATTGWVAAKTVQAWHRPD